MSQLAKSNKEQEGGTTHLRSGVFSNIPISRSLSNRLNVKLKRAKSIKTLCSRYYELVVIEVGSSD